MTDDWIVKRVYSGASGGVVAYLRMHYAGSQVAFETDSVGTTLRTRYTWGPGTDQLVSLRDTTNTHYVAVTDQLGSVRALVKRDGTWAGRLRYDPYGNLVDSAGPQPPLRYRWTGREWDAETGFYFHRTRYYDPQAQRFVQEDAIGYAGGANLYAYVGGRPLTIRDPDGRLPIYDKYAWPDCCQRSDWDGWIGITGSILPSLVTNVYLNGHYVATMPGRPFGNAGVTFEVDLRQLSEDEIARLGTLCSSSGTNCGEIWLLTDAAWLLKDDRAFTAGHLIIAPWEDEQTIQKIPDLAHEVTHVIQYELLGFEWYFKILGGEYLQDRAHPGRSNPLNPYNWEAQLAASPGKTWYQLTFEGQAQSVGECFAEITAACAVSPYQPW